MIDYLALALAHALLAIGIIRLAGNARLDREDGEGEGTHDSIALRKAHRESLGRDKRP